MRHEIQFELNLVGTPIVPDDLQKVYDDHSLIREGASRASTDSQKRIIEREARAAYLLWKANGFRPVKITQRDHDELGQSQFCTPENNDMFTMTYPDAEPDCDIDCISDVTGESICDHKQYEHGEKDMEYLFDEAMYTMNTAQAQKWCDDCPLRQLCLASSITLDVTTRSGNISTDKNGRIYINERDMEEIGVYGGYGSRGRDMIRKRMLEILKEEYGTIPEEYRPYYDSEGGFWGYDRDEFGLKLAAPKALGQQGRVNEVAERREAVA